MALSQKALQKKREKKKRSRSANVFNSVQTKSIRSYSKWPVYECLVPNSLWEAGIGHIIVSRKGSSGNIAVGMYLLDVFCLGVKDCFVRIVDAIEYKEMIKNVRTHTGELEIVEPSYANTLIYKAKEYAMQLGFKPHKEFLEARCLLEDISIDETLSFNFGKDNKPFYVQGPNASPADVQRIMHTLQTNFKQEDYDYLIEG